MVLIFYLIYAFIALFGCSQIKEGLNPKNLVRESFYLNNFYVLIDETFWQEGLQMQVVVNDPPNLFDSNERRDFEKMREEFEGTTFTMNHNATMLWLDAFEAKMAEDETILNVTAPKSAEEWYEKVQEWLITAGGRRLWELDMVWDKSAHGSASLKAFRFQVGLRNYRTPTDHTNSCKLMRQIAAKFPEMNITTFHEYYPFADQYLELKPALFRNILLAVICMMVVSLLMIPNYFAALTIIAAIISIDVGVLGYVRHTFVNKPIIVGFRWHFGESILNRFP